MGQFVHNMCNAILWCHTETPWPFISKVRASGCKPSKRWQKKPKNAKFSFLHCCTQILDQLSNVGQFVHNMFTAISWGHTEASWPFISIVRAFGCNMCKHWLNNKKTPNSVFRYCCTQILHQLGNMGQFVHNMCNAILWCHTEAPWPFISIVRASGFNM